MSILLPLYIYPWHGGWDAIYWEASKTPNVNYTAIINPCSGPCLSSLPEQPYLDEIPKLKSYPNIRTVGYVATNYTEKDINIVLAEIRQWGLYPSLLNDSRFAVDGIFFDEVPGPYQWQKHDYMKAANDAVKANSALGQKVVVHNPGVLPDPVWNYLDVADITVIFEDTFTNFINGDKFNALKNFHTVTNLPTSAFSVMLHSVGNIPDELVQWAAQQMKQIAGWNWATNVATPGEYWHTWPTLLDTWVTKYAAR